MGVGEICGVSVPCGGNLPLFSSTVRHALTKSLVVRVSIPMHYGRWLLARVSLSEVSDHDGGLLDARGPGPKPFPIPRVQLPAPFFAGIPETCWKQKNYEDEERQRRERADEAPEEPDAPDASCDRQEPAKDGHIE